jgi:hypothetical protein
MIMEAQNAIGEHAATRAVAPAARKATRKEAHQRVYEVAQLLAQRIPKHQIKRLLRNKFGIGGRQSETYLARAREYLLERSQRDRADHISDATGLYERIIRDPESTKREQMDAQAAIRQMLGLDQPTKIAPTTPDGKSSYIPNEVIKQLSMEELECLSRIRARLIAFQQASRLTGPGDADVFENLKVRLRAQ